MWRLSLQNNFSPIIFKWKDGACVEMYLQHSVNVEQQTMWTFLEGKIRNFIIVSLWPCWLYKHSCIIRVLLLFSLHFFECMFASSEPIRARALLAGDWKLLCSWISTETILSARLNLEVASQWKNTEFTWAPCFHANLFEAQVTRKLRICNPPTHPPTTTKPFSPPLSLLFAFTAVCGHSWGVYADRAFSELLWQLSV